MKLVLLQGDGVGSGGTLGSMSGLFFLLCKRKRNSGMKRMKVLLDRVIDYLNKTYRSLSGAPGWDVSGRENEGNQEQTLGSVLGWQAEGGLAPR